MKVKYIVDEDFVNYKLPSMFIGCHSCTFKCGYDICQNYDLVNQPDTEIETYKLVGRYLSNPITSAVVFGGLEPFDDIDNVIDFIQILRKDELPKHNDEVVIYTGYTEEEIKNNFSKQYQLLSNIGNITIKYGRFIPNHNPHYDEVLGVKLYSDNQYAKRI